MSATSVFQPSSRQGLLPERVPDLAVGAIIALCASKFLLHLFTSVRHYGYLRDELYYLDLARHLDWGYVDCAPLVAIYAKVALLMGGSLAALRIIPAVAGAALVAIAVLLARELGGGRYAELVAGLSILLCPAFLVMDSLMTMNAFEQLFWMGCALILARILRTGDSSLWLWFGVLAGLGLENKHSMLSFGFGGCRYAPDPQSARIREAVDLDCRRHCSRAGWTHGTVAAVIVVATTPIVPTVTWMLSPERLLAYQNAIGFKPAKVEVHHESLLMQPIADQFGWPEMASQVAAIYNSLPPSERVNTGIFVGNYARPGRSINLVRNTDCLAPGHVTRTIGIGDRPLSRTRI